MAGTDPFILRCQRLRPLLVALTFALAVWPQATLAHAVLVRAEPPDLCVATAVPRVSAGDPRCATGAALQQSPGTIRLWFSEPVTPVGSGIAVVGPSGRRVERGPAQADGAELSVAVDAQEEGTYQVRWRVVARDTHPARGAFAFSVGAPGGVLASAAPGEGPAGAARDVPAEAVALEALARWSHFAGYALAFGVLAFARFVARRPWPQAGSERLVAAGIAALLLAEPLALAAQAWSLAGDGPWDPGDVADLLGSSFGRSLAQRLGAALLLWVLLGVGAPAAGWVVLALGLALALVDGLAAHAASVDPAWLGLLLNALHVAAMGLWVGGLAALVASRSTVAAGSAACECRALARRFAPWAAGCLAVLAASGTASAWLHLPRLDLLAQPGWARALAAKLVVALAAAALALAARRLSPALRLRLWRLEFLALLTVLALSGLLVALPLPR